MLPSGVGSCSGTHLLRSTAPAVHVSYSRTVIASRPPGRRLEVKQAERAAGLVATRLDRHQNLQVPEGFATLRIQGEELVRHLAHLVLLMHGPAPVIRRRSARSPSRTA